VRRTGLSRAHCQRACQKRKMEEEKVDESKGGGGGGVGGGGDCPVTVLKYAANWDRTMKRNRCAETGRGKSSIESSMLTTERQGAEGW